MTDIDILTAAIAHTCPGRGGKYQFSKLIGHRSSSRVYAWAAGSRPLPPWLVQLCELMLDVPGVVEWLREANLERARTT